MASRVLPADSELVFMRDELGMTHQQIADEISRRIGRRVARSTVSAALVRSGETKTDRPRYEATVPWRVAPAHAVEYPVRMLRLLGRRMLGRSMDKLESSRLDSWLQMLEDTDQIVVYCEDPPEGRTAFHYVTSAAKDHDDPVPIRKQPVTRRQIGY